MKNDERSAHFHKNVSHIWLNGCPLYSVRILDEFIQHSFFSGILPFSKSFAQSSKI